MRITQYGLIIATSIFVAACSVTAGGAEEPYALSDGEIEKLVKERIVGFAADYPPVYPKIHANLLKYRLVELQRLNLTRWQGKVELQLDFGPPPPSILGFQRIRKNRYQIVITRENARFSLIRLAPVGSVNKIPARQIKPNRLTQ